jgi:hypothetical protein
MIYYFFDFNTDIVLFADTDPYLVSNLAEGILNCKLGQYPLNDQLSDVLLEYSKTDATFNGIKIDFIKSQTSNVSLENFPELQYNRQLISLRYIAFKELLHNYKLCLFRSSFGFNDIDALTLNYGVTNEQCISEYARITNATAEFAKSELSLIHESVLQERFRAFTAALEFKKKINNTTTMEEINKLTMAIRNVFFNLGLRDA